MGVRSVVQGCTLLLSLQLDMGLISVKKVLRPVHEDALGHLLQNHPCSPMVIIPFNLIFPHLTSHRTIHRAINRILSGSPL